MTEPYTVHRVFVLGTGRCGSTTFAHACKFITNFTSAHESQIPADLETPSGHIEVSPRLTWLTPMLRNKYLHDDSVFFVHLRRDRDAVIDSWLKRGMHRGPGYFRSLVWGQDQQLSDRETCETCYSAMTTAIDRLCDDFPDQHLVLQLENIEVGWDIFCESIAATGNLIGGRAALTQRLNAS